MPSRFPSRDRLLDYDINELRRALKAAGYEPDQREIRAAADRVFDRVAKAIAEGRTELDPDTWEMIDKALERAFADALRRQIKALGRAYRLHVIEAAGESVPLRWVAMLIKTCRSCLLRHGKEKTLGEWESEGMPGSAALLCDGHCMCDLLPVPPDGYMEIYGRLAEWGD